MHGGSKMNSFSYETVNELEEAREELLEALERFRNTLKAAGGNAALTRLDAYAYAHIKIAAGGEHGYLGNSMYSLADAIDEVREAIEQPEDE